MLQEVLVDFPRFIKVQVATKPSSTSDSLYHSSDICQIRGKMYGFAIRSRYTGLLAEIKSIVYNGLATASKYILQ